MIPIGTKLNTITQEQLKYRLDYNINTGIFKWLVTQFDCNIGKEAGCVFNDRAGRQYLVIQLHKKTYKAHQLSWLYQTGSFPYYPLTHKDGNGLNNRWDNLAEIIPQKLNKNIKLTQEHLKSRVSYDPLTGIFIWLTPHYKKDLNKEAGHFLRNSKTGKTYIHINIQGNAYLAHRLAWLYMTGSFPMNQIDHIDGNGLNNIFSNLRDVTHTENKKNKKLYKNNTSNVCGVSFHIRSKKWIAIITNKGCTYHLGYFNSKEEAISIRKTKEIELDFHPNHGKE